MNYSKYPGTTDTSKILFKIRYYKLSISKGLN